MFYLEEDKLKNKELDNLIRMILFCHYICSNFNLSYSDVLKDIYFHGYHVVKELINLVLLLIPHKSLLKKNDTILF